MRAMHGWSFAPVALGGLVLALASRETNAQQPVPDRVVLSIGAHAGIGAAALEARIAALPPFQRVTFGPTREAVVRRFLSEVVVPELLVTVAAREAGLEKTPSGAFAVDRVLAGAVIRSIKAALGVPSSVSAADVRAYFEANRARYESPERYRIARILCRTREEAMSVLSVAKADASPKTFGDLAREHSQDKATYLRAGDLGLVAEDGSSNEPGVRVDPVVVQAARTVADGALVPQPIAEGDFFAVVWRRGTMPATKRAVDEIAPQIRDAVLKARLKEQTDKLLLTLRAVKVHDENDSLLDTLDLAEPERNRD